MLPILLIGGTLLIAGFTYLIHARPDEFRVMRQTYIDAPQEKIAPLINDFHAWTQWSPWEKLDPTMARTYSGAERGLGAAYAWNGNAKAGAGRMEIKEDAPGKIVIDLSFEKPMKQQNVTEFLLIPAGQSTRLTWVMRGKYDFVQKAATSFFDMDELVGKDFEAGLAALKAAAEK